jgi:branched-chain amino acid transport system ATP-binding protein
MVLSCGNVWRHFGGVRALAGVTVALRGPGVIGIIGPNGAGKTTLINVLSGFTSPDSGCVQIDGRDVTGWSADRIARLGVVRTFQQLRVFASSSVMENVLVALPSQGGESIRGLFSAKRVAREETANRALALELLERVGIASKAYEPAGQLSYGQQKLLNFASCLATEAHAVILDEPVAGVGLPLVEVVLGLIQDIKKQGKLVLFIEHNLAAARRVADSILVMDEGRIIAQGSADEVFGRPELLEAYIA